MLQAAGVVILDKDGKLCQIINKASGLRNELVLHIFADQQGGLWLGLNNGIARVESPSPVSRFKDSSGMDSFVESIIRYQGSFILLQNGEYIILIKVIFLSRNLNRLTELLHYPFH